MARRMHGGMLQYHEDSTSSPNVKFDYDCMGHVCCRLACMTACFRTMYRAFLFHAADGLWRATILVAHDMHDGMILHHAGRAFFSGYRQYLCSIIKCGNVSKVPLLEGSVPVWAGGEAGTEGEWGCREPYMCLALSGSFSPTALWRLSFLSLRWGKGRKRKVICKRRS